MTDTSEKFELSERDFSIGPDKEFYFVYDELYECVRPFFQVMVHEIVASVEGNTEFDTKVKQMEAIRVGVIAKLHVLLETAYEEATDEPEEGVNFFLQSEKVYNVLVTDFYTDTIFKTAPFRFD